MQAHSRKKLKICILGERAIGKTSLAKRFVEDIFSEDYLPTLGTRLSKKRITLKKHKTQVPLQIDLTIWDIMGQKTYRKYLYSNYLKGIKGALLVCDLTRKETLESLEEWVDSLASEWHYVPFVLVGTKSDLTDRLEFGTKEIAKLASKHASSFLTSAKTGENVETAFRALGRKIMEDIDQIPYEIDISDKEGQTNSMIASIYEL